ncbi:MAG: 2-phospho-L-lactate transferase CofD family protein [Planctomycetota bacterium]|nr:2-phospho-L-lactate transferase CofD family protein [Planctomycetota bacterium]
MNPLRIASIGCGTGQAVVLQALAHVAGAARMRLDVSAIVGVTDNGGHSGLLRKELGVPQVGDTRACLVAAARNPLLAGLLDFRFSRGRLKGVCLGNLLLATETVRRGSLVKAAAALGSPLGTGNGVPGSLSCPWWKQLQWPTMYETKAMRAVDLKLEQEQEHEHECCRGGRGARGGDNLAVRVVPVSDESGDICAELVNGKIIRGEWQIIKRKPRTEIRCLFHTPRLDAHPAAVAAARNADVVVVAPGSLRTGIVSVLLARGMREALAGSGARIVYVANIMTQSGQTDGFTLADHVDELSTYLGRTPTDVIVNTARPTERLLEYYRARGCSMVPDELLSGGIVAHHADMVGNPSGKALARLGRARTGRMHAGPHFIRHDPVRLARVLGLVLGA